MSGGQTHYDPVEAGAICHDDCAILLISRLREDRDALMDAMQKIVQWADAYPTDVFLPPDWAKVREALAAQNISLDSVSAANMRHVVTGVGAIARAAVFSVQTRATP